MVEAKAHKRVKIASSAKFLMVSPIARWRGESGAGGPLSCTNSPMDAVQRVLSVIPSIGENEGDGEIDGQQRIFIGGAMISRRPCGRGSGGRSTTRASLFIPHRETAVPLLELVPIHTIFYQMKISIRKSLRETQSQITALSARNGELRPLIILHQTESIGDPDSQRRGGEIR